MNDRTIALTPDESREVVKALEAHLDFLFRKRSERHPLYRGDERGQTEATRIRDVESALEKVRSA